MNNILKKKDKSLWQYIIILIGMLLLMVLLLGCDKKSININDTEFTSMTIHENFNWSAGNWIINDSLALNLKTPVCRYPAEGYYYQIYEDLWPSLGDYDFNDVVLKSYMIYRTNTKEGTIYSKVLRDAGGLSPHNVGFEILKYTPNKLFYIDTSKVNVNNIRYIKYNGSVSLNYEFDNDQNLIYFNKIHTNDSLIFDFQFHPGHVPFFIQPFISLKNNTSKEMHIYGYPPSDNVDISYFNTKDDASDVNKLYNEKANGFWNLGDLFYNTSNYYPWGIELVSDTFYIPLERTEILLAYPQFKGWAESNGTLNTEWFKYPDINYCY